LSIPITYLHSGSHYLLSYSGISCVPATDIQCHNHSYFSHKIFFLVVFVDMMETEKLDKLRKFNDFYASMRRIETTVSTWVDPGNWSTALTFSRW
jgi:hypothetical protein